MEVRVERAGARILALDDHLEGLHLARAAEESLPGAELEQHDPEREDVAASVER